jgi:hypothetical protein
MAPLPPFDQDKPFYPLVMNFVAAIHGWNNIAARRVGQMVAATEAPDRQLREAEQGLVKMQNPASLADLRDAAQLPAWIAPLQLGCRTQDEAIDVNIDHLADEATNLLVSESPVLFHAAEHLLVVAREMTRDYASFDDPLWEFLRHCRNAAGHGGRFYFSTGEPRNPARFRNLEITGELQGTPLFRPLKKGVPGTENVPGILCVGDPIPLLWEIEQANPEMMVS